MGRKENLIQERKVTINHLKAYYRRTYADAGQPDVVGTSFDKQVYDKLDEVIQWAIENTTGDHEIDFFEIVKDLDDAALLRGR